MDSLRQGPYVVYLNQKEGTKRREPTLNEGASNNRDTFVEKLTGQGNSQHELA